KERPAGRPRVAASRSRPRRTASSPERRPPISGCEGLLRAGGARRRPVRRRIREPGYRDDRPLLRLRFGHRRLRPRTRDAAGLLRPPPILAAMASDQAPLAGRRIATVGSGVMAEAMIAGLLRGQIVEPGQVIASH